MKKQSSNFRFFRVFRPADKIFVYDLTVTVAICSRSNACEAMTTAKRPRHTLRPANPARVARLERAARAGCRLLGCEWLVLRALSPETEATASVGDLDHAAIAAAEERLLRSAADVTVHGSIIAGRLRQDDGRVVGRFCLGGAAIEPTATRQSDRMEDGRREADDAGAASLQPVGAVRSECSHGANTSPVLDALRLLLLQAVVLDRVQTLRDRERKLARSDRRLLRCRDTELRRLRRLLDQTSRLARVGAWEYDVPGRSLTWSLEIFRILDLDPAVQPSFEEVPQFYREDIRDIVVGQMRAALLQGQPIESEFPVVTATGRNRWVRFVCEALMNRGRVVRLIGTVQDISDQRAKEEEVTFIATHDVMTGLPNRAVFRERLDSALAAAGKGTPPAQVGLVLIDIDHFKTVNDTLGHQAGDALLVEAARRIVVAAAGRGIAARLGGDEFALLVPGPIDRDELQAIGERVSRILVQPVHYGEESIPVTASVGIALSMPNGLPDDLLKDADIALYEAKNAGRNRAVTFDRSMREEIELRHTILRTVRQALDRNEMILHYQPKIRLSDGRLFGFEALLRWSRSDGFVAGPSFFGAALEDPHLSRVIGDLVIERTIAQAAEWHRRAFAFGHIAINVATSQFRRGDLAELVNETLCRHRAPAESLIVEVTENVLLSRDADEVRVTLERLSALGVKIALDDFGTGYASLTHLKDFPVDLLKIDRSFVSTLHEHRESQAIVRSISALARDLGIQVIAEGIETAEQQELVSRLGASIGQGYYFARPMAGTDVEERYFGADGHRATA